MNNDLKKINKVLDKMTDDKEKNIKVLKKYFKLNGEKNSEEIKNIYRLAFGIYEMTNDNILNTRIITKSNFLLLEALIEYSKSLELLYLIDFYEILYEVRIDNIRNDNCKKLLEIIINNNISISDRLYKDYEVEHKCLFYKISKKSLSFEMDEIYELLKKSGYNIFSVCDDYIRMDDYLKNFKEKLEISRFRSKFRNHSKSLIKQCNKARLDFLKKYENERKQVLHLSNEEILERVKNEFPNLYSKAINEFEVLYRVAKPLLFDVVSIYIDEEYSLRIIEAFLASGIDPNETDDGHTFIEYAFMKTKHSEEYIYKLLELAIKYGYNVNSVDYANKTIMHNLIENCFYKFNNISNIYKLLLQHGFDSLIKDKNNKTIYDLIIEYKNSFKEYDEIIKLYNNYVYNNKNEDIKYFNKFRKDLSINNYSLINKDIKFSKNKLNFITGKQGLGKRDNLINLYLSDSNNSIYITKEDILNECEFIGDYKAKILNIIRLCSFNNITLYVESFDDIISNLKDIDKKEILMIIELYNQKYNLKLNAIINDKSLIEDPLMEGVVNEIKLTEPTFEEIKLFITNTLSNYETKYNKKIDNLNLLEEIIYILMKNIDNDEISNLKVFYDFINNLFNTNDETITIDNIIDSLYNLENINHNCKIAIVDELSNLNNDMDYENIVKKLKKI